MNEDNQNQSAPETSGGGMGTKTLVSWLIVIIIIIGGIFYFSSSETEDYDDITESDDDSAEVMEDGVLTDEEVATMEDNKNVITYTNDGFSPDELTIKKGESVTFVNESGSGMWVGSAMHPTHKNYPIKSDSDCLGSSFDQCESTNNRTEWTFTFEAEGEHGYHNHVKANHWGKVIVE
jgi:plastocyanin